MKNDLISPIALYSELLEECQAMTKYALTSGMVIPEKVVQTVYDYTRLHHLLTVGLDRQSANAQEGSEEKSQPRVTSLSDDPYDLDLQALVTTHQRLAQIVKPATPRTLTSLAAEAAKGGWFSFLSPVPLVRRLVLLALLFILLFIGVSLTTEANGQATLNDSGLRLLANELLFLAAAGLGAIFAMLFRINSSITDGSYDSRLEGSYWVKMVLGLVAGLLLAVLIPLPESSQTLFLGPTVVALLGGFSSELFLRILNRLIETVESLILGMTQEQVEVNQAKAALRRQKTSTQERLSVVGKATQLQQQLLNSAEPEAIKKQVNELLGDLIAHSISPSKDAVLHQNGLPSKPQITATGTD